eukprot:TRINITY_DN4895_c0_g2_i1.p1 TRINITY_DN4895_c0_g2~~TRINITY_DN4895_c0_g2_i1.p1  ORF type:complete len:1118 (+),score=320.55 TRINITY_DN4895_c0_g2_i1:280-3633(+)
MSNPNPPLVSGAPTAIAHNATSAATDTRPATNNTQPVTDRRATMMAAVRKMSLKEKFYRAAPHLPCLEAYLCNGKITFHVICDGWKNPSRYMAADGRVFKDPGALEASARAALTRAQNSADPQLKQSSQRASESLTMQAAEVRKQLADAADGDTKTKTTGTKQAPPPRAPPDAPPGAVKLGLADKLKADDMFERCMGCGHGLAEHGDLYNRTAEELEAKIYIVFQIDHCIQEHARSDKEATRKTIGERLAMMKGELVNTHKSTLIRALKQGHGASKPANGTTQPALAAGQQAQQHQQQGYPPNGTPAAVPVTTYPHPNGSTTSIVPTASAPTQQQHHTQQAPQLPSTSTPNASMSTSSSASASASAPTGTNTTTTTSSSSGGDPAYPMSLASPFERPTITQITKNFVHYKFAGRLTPQKQMALEKLCRAFVYVINNITLPVPSTKQGHHTATSLVEYSQNYQRWLVYCRGITPAMMRAYQAQAAAQAAAVKAGTKIPPTPSALQQVSTPTTNGLVPSVPAPAANGTSVTTDPNAATPMDTSGSMTTTTTTPAAPTANGITSQQTPQQAAAASAAENAKAATATAKAAPRPNMYRMSDIFGRKMLVHTFPYVVERLRKVKELSPDVMEMLPTFVNSFQSELNNDRSIIFSIDFQSIVAAQQQKQAQYHANDKRQFTAAQQEARKRARTAAYDPGGPGSEKLEELLGPPGGPLSAEAENYRPVTASIPSRRAKPPSLDIPGFDGEGPTKSRDANARNEDIDNTISFRFIKNDNSAQNVRWLAQAKHIFATQLPKMPKEYICRLVFDKSHRALVIVKNNNVAGAISFRPCPAQGFLEIAFLAITEKERVRGYGTHLMNHLKEVAKEFRIYYFLTYADNHAIGYFKKQGFTLTVSLPREKWTGYIKDYDGGTLMECIVDPKVHHLDIPNMVRRQRDAMQKKIREVSNSHVRHAKLAWFSDQKQLPAKDRKIIAPSMVPGLVEAGYTKKHDAEWRREQVALHKKLRNVYTALSDHEQIWVFKDPVDPNEVTDYYDVVKNPIDMSEIGDKLDSENYYVTPYIFRADVRRMIANARLYNQKDTVFYKAADAVGSLAESWFKDLIPEMRRKSLPPVSPMKKENKK